MLHMFTLLYLLLLPLVSYDTLGYFVIPEGERARKHDHGRIAGVPRALDPAPRLFD